MEVARFEPCNNPQKKFETCSVRGCNSSARKDPTVRFHKFPWPGKHFVKLNNEKVDRFLAWKSLLQIDRINPKTKVCSLHFLKSDYFFPDIVAKKRMLKKIAVPSCNLPGDDGSRLLENNSKSRIVPNGSSVPTEEFVFVKVEPNMEDENFETHTEVNSTLEQSNSETVVIKTELPTGPCFKDAEVQATLKPSVKDAEVQANPFIFECFIKRKVPEVPTKDAEAQVNTDCFVSSVLHSIKTDSDLFVSTGIESFDLLDVIVRRVIEICGDKYEHPNMRLNTRDRIIMAYMKCKHNLSYSFLSILFGHYTPTHCQRIFVEILELLGKCSKEGIPWLSVNEIPKNLRKRFENSSDPITKPSRRKRAIVVAAATNEKGEKGKEEELKEGSSETTTNAE